MNSTEPSFINAPAPTEVAPPLEAPRCQHRTPKGRCRQLATDPQGALCFDHGRAQLQAKNDFSLLAPLVRKPEDFQSAESINESLGALHNLLAEGRISPRRAAVIAYVDSLILRTIQTIAHETEHAPLTLIYDAPRPNHDAPSLAPAEKTSP